MASEQLLAVFVHGWSVTTIDTYGGLPERLRAEAAAAGIDMRLEDIHLGRYISFHDEVTLADLSRALRSAVAERIAPLLSGGRRFVCITHSTGGPVVRDWWHRYYASVPGSGKCPMSHLVMLAPANFGSALAQLGKGRVGRLKAWAGGVEPGQGVLDWLELGSEPAFELNRSWIATEESQIGAGGVFPFVLTGQTIDRKLYDNLNSYTGESGSDGVVRVAAASLNARYLRLEQEAPTRSGPKRWKARNLVQGPIASAPETALRVIAGKSHSGTDIGIMRSVKEGGDDAASAETVDCILRCLRVRTKTQYNALVRQFAQETADVQRAERIEKIRGPFRRTRVFLHDRYSMVIFRIRDDEGYPVSDFDLMLTAGPRNDPDHLPTGFFVDRQRNSVHPNTVTYYLNYDRMSASEAVVDAQGKVHRAASEGAGRLGFKLKARPQKGFVHYLDAEISATEELLKHAVVANATTLVDIVLRRIVNRHAFRIDRRKDIDRSSFKRTSPGPDIAE